MTSTGYQPFARKYRPQTWATVVGQDHVTTTLKNALAVGRLHHAYLFAGSRGVGKTTVARLLAKALNCSERGSAPEPCNGCRSCMEITEGRSLDIQEIDGASNTSVDDVREIRERVKYLPAAGQYKVYIVDEVHMLSTAAFNALLKTLEEPPPHVIFVLATTEAQKIPATILSRCQRYDFRRVSVVRIVETLQAIATDEGIVASPDVLHCLAYEAQGSLRDAESLLDQVVAFAGKALTPEGIRQLLGLTDRRTLMTLCEQVVAREATAALTGLEEAFQTGANLPRLARDCLEIFRHAWIAASCGAVAAGAELPPAEREAVATLAKRATLPEFQQWFAIAYRWADEVARSTTPRLALEAMLLQMIQVGPVQPVAELLERVEEMMQTPNQRPEPRREETDDQKPEETHANEWNAFLTALRTTKPQLVSILEHGEPVVVSNTRIELAYPKDSLYGEMLREPDRLAMAHEAMRTHFGAGCRVTIATTGITAGAPAPAEEKARARAEKQEEQKRVRQAAAEHALVKEAAHLFGAEIKEIKNL